MLFSLADEGHAPKALQKLTKRGIPLLALCVSMLGGLASLISSVVAPTTVYLVLVSVAGFATVGVWMSITAAHFFHRRNFLREGGDTATLPYRAPLFPLLPIAAFILCVISLIGIGFDPTQATALYFGIPFVAACYAYFHFKHGRGKKAPKDQDPKPQKINAP
jgi:S-methylmethionine transporter